MRPFEIVGRRPSRALLPVVCWFALAALPLTGCATMQESAPAAPGSDDGGGVDGDDAATLDVAPPDAGSTFASPIPLGVSLFAQTCGSGGPTVDWSPMRRLSRVEYNNMVRDLLGDTTQPANAFPPESPMGHGVNFETNTYAGVSALAVQDYMQAAETLAASAVKGNTLNNTLLTGCTSQTDMCAQQFIDRWANRAMRGQLDPDESKALFALYSDVKSQLDFVGGIQAVVTAVLQSPRFLYVMEFGSGSPAGRVVPLSQYEIAARLALFLWRSVPDDALMTAAAQGQLATADQIAQQATRMLTGAPLSATGLPQAADALDDFTTQWMQLQGTATQGKDTQFSASWTQFTGQEQKEESLLNVSQLVLADNGTLTDLLTSPESYLSPALEMFYGVAHGSGKSVPLMGSSLPSGNTTFVRTTLPNRAGLLTSGAVLSTQSHTTLPSSVLRGKLVRENVLCDPISPPPPGIPPAATMRPDGGTTRGTLEAHFNQQPCVGCHKYMDPIGLGFGHFDATGAYQAADVNGWVDAGGPPIDATGQVMAAAAGEASFTFDGAGDLVTQLSTAPQVRQCFALQELRYALGRIETTSDACSAQQIYGAFSSATFNVRQLLIAIVRSDAFRYRSVQTAGSGCQ